MGGITIFKVPETMSCEPQLIRFYHDLVSNLDRVVNRCHKQTDVSVMAFARSRIKGCTSLTYRD